MNRREFLHRTSAVALTGAVPWTQSKAKKVDYRKLPRWRGFNLLEKFDGAANRRYVERDFEWMREWGFDFARLPMSYRCWSTPDDWLRMDDAVLGEVDEAVRFGERHRIHVNLNLHRAPGYCVNPPAEPSSLWTDETAQKAATHHWRTFAKRYRGIPSVHLSFNLLNEPAMVTEPAYEKVVTRLVEAIREEDADRLIIADGLAWGTQPCRRLVGLKIAQSARGYTPMALTHYRAEWASLPKNTPKPTHPLVTNDETWNRELLHKRNILPWKELERQGVGIHVGEWGCYNKTPHAVALAWMAECLKLWKEAGWGWALWNLRGAFGPVNSGRTDVSYEPFHGEQLDRKMLELLRSY